MRRVATEEFAKRNDRNNFKSVVIKGDEYQEYANKSIILRALTCVISASALAEDEPIDAVSKLGQLGLSEFQATQTRNHIIIGMLVSYARCFASGIYKIKKEDYLKPGAEIDNHNYLLELRNTYAAHNVSHLRSTSVDLRVLSESDEYVLSSRGSDVVFDGTLAKLISLSAALVKNRIEQEIDQLEKHLEEDLNNKTIEDLRNLPEYQQPPVDMKKVGKRRPS